MNVIGEKQRGLLVILDGIAQSLRTRLMDCDTDAALDEIGERLARINDMMQPAPEGREYAVSLVPAGSVS